MDIKTFITSGNATGTLASQKSGMHFTYKFRAAKSDPNLFFVSLLTGSDNEKDFSYLGLLRVHAGSGHLGFNTTKKSCAGPLARSAMGLKWMLAKLNRGQDLGPSAKFQHEGRCGRCGRKLTHPESIESGLGPECATKV